MPVCRAEVHQKAGRTTTMDYMQEAPQLIETDAEMASRPNGNGVADGNELGIWQLNTHDAVRYHWRVWELTGLIQPAGMSRPLHLLRAILINALVTLLFPLTLLAKLFFTHSLQELCENLTITITDIAANFKFINVYLVRRQLAEIRRLLQQLDRRAIGVQHPEELQALQLAINMARNSFRIFAGIFVFGTALSCLRVTISRERTLLYPAWFGIDWQHSDAAYLCLCGYQLFGLAVQALQDCANDSYPPAYLCILTGHMRALELRVRRIGYPAWSSRSVSCDHQRWRRAVHVELCSCIDDYINIIKLHAIIQQILSIACLAQFLCSAAVQCTVGMHFLYVTDSNDLSAMALSMVFFIAVTLEVFIICYFGDRMRGQSEKLCDAFYACNWVDQTPQFRRILIITLMTSQQTFCIYAGGYIAVTLKTFVQVIRSTWSVFTLLLRAK
ncbi:odorant receptor 2a [Drosophila novamexicana]|uniref:odorant receptor 2a n=1 Tax=Drosophila novamexicana TaxID=47314 RepID=UPI0011E5DFFF|nr:odorant receptor 2a [Drosophila novamexicana]